MDLHCNEAACIKRAYMDPVLVVDDRVLHNMLQTETFYIIQNDYFSLVQKDLQPHMRKIVSEWMLEVSYFSYLFIYEIYEAVRFSSS